MAELFFFSDGVTPPIVPGANFVPLFNLEVKIAWSPLGSGFFTLDQSILDGPDELAPSVFSQSFDGPDDDITSYVDKVSVRRGRDANLGDMQAGEATIVGRDSEGRFNPANPNSELATWIKKPLRPARIRATFNGVTYGVYWGFTRRLTFEPSGRGGTFQIELVDLFERLRRVRPVILSALGPTTTGEAIGRVLDYVGWTDVAMRSLDNGPTIPDFYTDGSDDALKVINDLVEPSLGVFFIGRDGIAYYRDVDYRNTSTIYTTVGDGMRAIAPGLDLDLIRSRVVVKRTDFGGAELFTATASDAAAEQDVGVSDYPELRSPYFISDDATQITADRLLTVVKDPRAPIFALKLSGRTDTLVEQVFGAELEYAVSAQETHTGTQGKYLLERTSLDIEGHKTMEASWSLSEMPVQGDIFTLDESFLDGTDVLGF